MSDCSTELVTLRLEMHRMTENAFLVLSDWDRKVWVPKSVCKGYTVFDRQTPYQIKFTIPVWMATKKGLV